MKNTLEHLSNEELVLAAISVLEELQSRPSLCEYLSEMSYDNETDTYERTYEDDTFDNVVLDCRKYLNNHEYKIDENKKQRL